MQERGRASGGDKRGLGKRAGRWDRSREEKGEKERKKNKRERKRVGKGGIDRDIETGT